METTTTTLDSTETIFLHTEWTDEKHSLYLKGMEAAFVNQLYASTDLIGLRSRNNNSLDQSSSRQMHCNNTSNLFGQFKVFRGSSWKKVCHGRTDHQRNKEDISRKPRKDPWIQNSRPICNFQEVADPALQETAESMDCRTKIISCDLATSSKHLHPNHDCCCAHDLKGSENGNVEVSDQNFAGEEIEGENGSNIYVQKRKGKRMKRPSTDYLNNAQKESSS